MKKIIILSIGLLFLAFSTSFSQNSDALEKGIELYESGRYSEAKNSFNEIIANGSTGQLQKAKAHYYLCKTLWQINDFQASLKEGDRAIFLFDSLDDPYWLGRIYYALCMNNLVAGNYDLALLQSEKAYDAFSIAQDTAFQIKSICRRGLVFHDIAEYKQGIEACNEADSLHARFSAANADIQAIIWGIKAINYDDMGRSDKAVEIYRAILKLEERLSSNREIIRTYNNMGNSLMKMGYLDEAKKYISLNLEAEIKNNFPYGIATAKTNLANIARQKGDYNSAQILLDEAAAIAYEISDQEKILDVLYQYYQLMESKNETQKALAYLNDYYSLKDSLYNLDKRRQVQFLEKRFESSQKEHQIELQKAMLAENKARLERNNILLSAAAVLIILIIIIALLNRNRIRKKQELALQKERSRTKELQLEASISSQEKERKRYARDLHDGIGQLISVLNLNLKKLETAASNGERKKVQDESYKVLDEMHREIKNICFDMMPQTLINMGLPAVIKEFADRINISGRIKVELSIFGFEKRPDALIELSLYRIIQEWVNNVLKYANAENIRIDLSADEREITLMIEDDGPGFDKSRLTEGNGNGWKNLNSRAGLIRGELSLETDTKRKGSVFILNCPRKATAVEENTLNMV